MFLEIDDNGDEIYDSRESALERARMLARLHGGLTILEQRRFAPNWFAHMVRGSWFEFFAYCKVV